MPSDCISYQDSGYFSKLMLAYLNEEKIIQPLYNRFPRIENFEAQILEKQADFSIENRYILSEALAAQYSNFEISSETKKNIELLQNTNTFTITTGHQLNLFTGPLYFLYKIISAINLTKELKNKYPNFDFVPVYWMATEDHDFDEIHYFNYEDKKFQWNKDASGPVGRLDLEDLDKVFTTFSTQLGLGENAKQLKKWFENAYLNQNNLAEATRYLANEIFGSHGLVILDGDDIKLKKIFAPYVAKELIEQQTFNEVAKSYPILKEYLIQVNPREINLFYMENGLRERIIFEDNLFKVNNTNINFTKEEILHLVETNPEKFSPNVILRPLYQEIILPNLCYIGGGGELAYWLELKEVFTYMNIPFPILLLRNSVLLTSEKQANKADKLNLSWKELFLKKEQLIHAKTVELSENNFDFEQQRLFLKKQFNHLKEVASKTDKSFENAVLAQEKKQLKGLDNLEKRLLKAERKLHTDILNRIVSLQLELFPKGSLQERSVNFSEFYKEYGNELIEKLFRELQPLEQNFTIVNL